MARFIKCLCIPALAIALLAVADAPSADAANGFSMHHGGPAIGTGLGKVHHPSSGATIRRNYRYRGHGIHFGHPGYWLMPHNGHFDVVPVPNRWPYPYSYPSRYPYRYRWH